MIRYAKPRTLDEALALLGEAPWRILAGGTDFYPALGSRPLSENVLDINGLAELRGISETASHIVIGARTTWTELIRHPLPPAFDALKQAAKEVGSVQIQNVASVAGNLCNASPAADGVPALMVLDAEVELSVRRGQPDACRSASSSSATARRRCGRTRWSRRSMYPRLRPPARRRSRNSARGAISSSRSRWRRRASWSAATAAVAKAAVAVGSCSAVAQRLSGLEAALVGLKPGREIAEAVEAADLRELAPIDDVRGSADYRRAAAREIVLRALNRALGDAVAEIAA